MTSPPHAPTGGPRITVVGSCNLDQVLTVVQPPGPGATVSATAYAEEPGGKGLNQALAAARAGARVSFIGAVGEDEAGEEVRRLLLDSGVETARLRRTADPTGRAVVVVEHDMDFVRRLDCKVTVLHQGSVLAEGSLDHVSANPDVIDVYLGR